MVLTINQMLFVAIGQRTKLKNARHFIRPQIFYRPNMGVLLLDINSNFANWVIPATLGIITNPVAYIHIFVLFIHVATIQNKTNTNQTKNHN